MSDATNFPATGSGFVVIPFPLLTMTQFDHQHNARTAFRQLNPSIEDLVNSSVWRFQYPEVTADGHKSLITQPQ